MRLIDRAMFYYVSRLHRQEYRCRSKIFLLAFLGAALAITTLPLHGNSEDRVLGEQKENDSFFPILCWSTHHILNNEQTTPQHGLESIKECHFTVAGFIHVKDIPQCESLGLKAFVYGDTDDVTRHEWNDMWINQELTDAEIDNKIRVMVERSGNSKSVIGYYLCDEPGASKFPRLGKAVQAIKKYAPGKLAYINLFPNYATVGALNMSQLETKTYAEYLDRFVREVNPQVLSYDNYQVQCSMDLSQPSGVALYYRNLLTVRRVSIQHGLPFWNVVSSNQIRPFTTIPSPANLSFQAYTTLAAGGHGVAWYTYYSAWYGHAPINTDGHKNLTWWYLQEVNRQLSILGPIMNRMHSTGVYFTSPAPTESMPVLPGKLIKQVDAKVPMMVGEFEDKDGREYAMIVNLSLRESVPFKIVAQDNRKPSSLISAADGRRLPFDNMKSHWLLAGQGVLLCWSDVR